MRNRQTFYLLNIVASLFQILSLGCGGSALVRIESTPDKAMASISVLGGSKKVDLGLTPNTTTTIADDFIGVPVAIEIKKEGFLSETIIIPDLKGLQLDFRKNLTAVPVPKAEIPDAAKDAAKEAAKEKEIREATEKQKTAEFELQKFLTIKKTNKNIDRLFEATRKIQASKINEAVELLSDIKKESPELSATYEIESNIHFMSNEFQKALDSLNEAIKHNPEHVALVHMKARLEKALNIDRKPAGGK